MKMTRSRRIEIPNTTLLRRYLQEEKGSSGFPVEG
jgi:hypothetical protein